MTQERLDIAEGVALCLGDNVATLRTMPDASVDAVVTDPPYGLSDFTAKDVASAVACWVRGEPAQVQVRGGFMAKPWDKFVPGPELWREVLRVLKPGGFCLAFAGSRTADLMTLALRLAGFDICDTIQAGLWSFEQAFWMYGQGFPKSINLGRQIDMKRCTLPGRHCDKTLKFSGDHLCPRHPDGDPWRGFGSALKPAFEPIIKAQRPLDGTYVDNFDRYGTGCINVDGCRVAGVDDVSNHARGEESAVSKGIYGDSVAQETHQTDGQRLGRWPSNVVFCHHPGCVAIGTKLIPKGRPLIESKADPSVNTFGDGLNGSRQTGALDETVTEWQCVDGCAVAILDAQSGIQKSGTAQGTARDGSARAGGYDGGWKRDTRTVGFGDTGGASRFYPVFEYTDSDAPFLYQAKASRSEREAGCEHLPARSGADAVDREPDSAGLANPRAGAGRTAMQVRNHWPTVKPVALMRWCVRLVTPPGGAVLDPFTGSGSTGVAAVAEGFGFIGIEREHDGFAIAEARLRHALTLSPPSAAVPRVPRPVSAGTDDVQPAAERPATSRTTSTRRRHEVAPTPAADPPAAGPATRPVDLAAFLTRLRSP